MSFQAVNVFFKLIPCEMKKRGVGPISDDKDRIFVERNLENSKFVINKSWTSFVS